MTSEQPDKYAYCENENNQNVVFLPNSESFWIKFDLWRFLSMQRKNSEFLKITISGKAKFKNQKFENSAEVKILSANLLFDCFNSPNIYRPLTETICRIKHCLRQTNWSCDVYFVHIKGRFSAMYNFIQNFQNKSVISVLICIKRYLQTQFDFNSEKDRLFLKSGNLFFFSVLQYAYLSGCSDIISAGRDLVFWIYKVKQTYILRCSIIFCSHLKSEKNKCHKHNMLNFLPAVYMMQVLTKWFLFFHQLPQKDLRTHPEKVRAKLSRTKTSWSLRATLLPVTSSDITLFNFILFKKSVITISKACNNMEKIIIPGLMMNMLYSAIALAKRNSLRFREIF